MSGNYLMYPYLYVLDHLRKVIDDKYVRLALKVVAASVYLSSGKYSDLWTQRMSPKYPIEKLITDVSVAGDVLAKTFLAYTILRITEPHMGWNIYILDISGTPFLMSSHQRRYRRIVAPRLSGRSRGFIDESAIDRGRYIPVCSVTDLKYYPPMADVLSRDRLLTIDAGRHLRQLGGDRYGEASLRMLKTGIDVMKVLESSDIDKEVLRQMREFATAYRALKAYDIILTRIPPPICRSVIAPPIPRNNEQFRPDIDILTQS